MGERWRPVAIGALFAVLVVMALVVYMVWARPPSDGSEIDEILMIGLVEDTDGAQVAGMLALVGVDLDPASVREFDPTSEVEGAGTSYAQLKDRYPFGGGAAVASAVSEIEGIESPEWIVLPADVWIPLVDSQGGVEHVVLRPTNAFVRGQLYTVEAGEQVLSGEEAHALMAAALHNEEQGGDSSIEFIVSDVLVSVLDEWPAVPDAVESGGAESSIPFGLLKNLGDGADIQD